MMTKPVESLFASTYRRAQELRGIVRRLLQSLCRNMASETMCFAYCETASMSVLLNPVGSTAVDSPGPAAVNLICASHYSSSSSRATILPGPKTVGEYGQVCGLQVRDAPSTHRTVRHCTTHLGCRRFSPPSPFTTLTSTFASTIWWATHFDGSNTIYTVDDVHLAIFIMSISVEKLNADTTFLLTFYPSIDAQPAQSRYTILFDPWLEGQSSWIHPVLQSSDHTITPTIASLADIEQHIDLIIVSQDKPDHCHKQTLCSWPKEKDIRILASPSAARRIRDWKHFNKNSISEIPVYTATEKRLIDIEIPSGKIQIANLVSKLDGLACTTRLASLTDRGIKASHRRLTALSSLVVT
ncbi:hypothetical protein MRB53_040193 [Persea americana]|nr:hypothetical protein MRB53_040193 [Persea americana]